MKAYRIAFCGVFDLANYGDHLFPIIFNSEMKKRGLDVELELFSPFECQQIYDESKHVYPLRNLEKMHLDTPFDAIVIAGGEVVHLFRASQITEIGSKNYKEYTISEVWLIPAFIANKYKIKLLWNCPGILLKFDMAMKNLVKTLCESIDYLSVRNIFSKECLKECGIDETKINVIPDTALLLSKSINVKKISDLRNKILPFQDKYIVFHCNKYIDENQIDKAIQCLQMLNKEGYRIVLLPIALTHGDNEILSKINKQAKMQFYEINEVLSINEIISIIEGCSMYIGVSFHGALTAIQFNKKAIAFDYMKYFKTKDLFDYFNISDCYITDEQKLEDAIRKTLNDIKKVDLNKAYEDLNIHFNHVYSMLTDINYVIKADIDFYYNITHAIVDLNKNIDNLRQENDKLKYLEEGIIWHRNHEIENKIYVESLEKVIEEQKQGLIWYQNLVEENNKYNSNLKESLEEQKQGLEWYQNQEEDNKKYNESLEKVIAEQRQGLEQYQNQEEENKKYNDNLEKIIAEQKQGLAWYQNQEEENKKYIKSLDKVIQEQEQGLEWHRKQDENNSLYIKSLELSIENKEDDIKKLDAKIEEYKVKQNELQTKIFTMENSLSWKITKFLRRK